LIKALGRMRYLILNSVKLNDDETLDYSPFLLTTDENEPTFFEIEFLISNKKYRYGFEYNLTKIIDGVI